MEPMGITSVTIENFKGISDPVTVPLRPITLLFGANSAGKSTVIQALLCLDEVLRTGQADIGKTTLSGGAIDLGGFERFVHGHDLTKTVSITVEVAGGPVTGPYWPDQGEYRSCFYSDYINSESLDVKCLRPMSSVGVCVKLAYDQAHRRAFVKEYEVLLDGEPFGAFLHSDDCRHRVGLNPEHGLFYWEESDLPLVVMKVVPLLERCASDYCVDCQAQTDPMTGEAPTPVLEPDSDLLRLHVLADTVVPVSGQMLDATMTGRDWQGFRDDRAYELNSVLSQLFAGAGDTVRRELRRVRYLGPLRDIPIRRYVPPRGPDPARWAHGLGAWDALANYTEQAPTLPDDGPLLNLVGKTSDYLHRTLGLGYTVRCTRVLSLEDDCPALRQLRSLAKDFGGHEARDVEAIIDAINDAPSTVSVRLHDERGDVDVDPQDVGVGVSQTLPVVVGAIEPDCSIFAVEQPELHVHPAAQSKMGDVFLTEALGGSNRGKRTFLLETHSEHLILRILRRIRETTDDELPSDMPKVRPEDIQVIYVKSTPEGATELHLQEITPDGDFADDWPDGFFTEREEDLF